MAKKKQLKTKIKELKNKNKYLNECCTKAEKQCDDFAIFVDKQRILINEKSSTIGELTTKINKKENIIEYLEKKHEELK